MTYAEIQDILKIPSGSLTFILHDCLGIMKHARLVSHNLNEEQKWGSVDWCTHMLKKFDGRRSPCIWDTVTGDETWVYQYEPKMKRELAVWVFPNENPLVKFKRNRSTSKQMIACFFAKFGHVVTIRLEDKKTFLADW